MPYFDENPMLHKHTIGMFPALRPIDRTRIALGRLASNVGPWAHKRNLPSYKSLDCYVLAVVVGVVKCGIQLSLRSRILRSITVRHNIAAPLLIRCPFRNVRHRARTASLWRSEKLQPGKHPNCSFTE